MSNMATSTSTDSNVYWLGKMDGNGTFYSSEYDPQFNIEDIREILDKDEEVDNT
mgnify:CR=1 FL=1